jgi:hypothetical protein
MATELPLKLNLTKERRVKGAVGLHCELCEGAYPSDLLVIHPLPGDGRVVRHPVDLQREILVLCPHCHREIHGFRLPRADQKTLVRSRPAGVRKAIRAILGYTPKRYTPPESDLTAVYEEIISGTCLNGSG